MLRFVIGSVVLLMLAACASGGGGTASDGNQDAVCSEQSDWARSGKVDGGDITITCPGNTRPAY